MVARAGPGYSDGLKHLRNTHRERVPDRTQMPALFPPASKQSRSAHVERLIRSNRRTHMITQVCLYGED
jgi:hypothetical protein